MTCRDAYEEKKARHIANIYVCLAFHSSYSPDDAGYLLRLAETLSYRQYKLLRISYDKYALKASLRDHDYKDIVVGPWMHSVLQETIDMIQQGLLEYRMERTFEQFAWLTAVGLIPNAIDISPFGKRFAGALKVRLIPKEEMEQLYKRLGYQTPANTNDDVAEVSPKVAQT